MADPLRHRAIRLLGLVGLTWLAACQAPRPAAEPRMVAVGARQLWLDCRGRGSPTVILEAGHTESADTWAAVQDSIARFTRVCSYDRAGRGHSPPAADSARRGGDAVADLTALLKAAAESPPFILVGHSLGGAFVRLFAAAHPTEVAGLVLVDAVHEDEFERIGALLTPEQRAAAAGMAPMSPEHFDIEAIFREVRAIADDPLAVPVTVIARGRPLGDDEMPPTWSPPHRAAREELRQALQRELAERFRRGRLVVATGSGHHVHHDEPSLVIAEIQRLVTEGRRAGGAG